MSINAYFLRQEARPRRKNPAPEVSDEQLANMDEEEGNTATMAEQQVGADRGSDSGLRSALREVVHDVTANVTKAMDEKLAPVLELLKKHGDTLDSHEKRLTETEQRIGALEDATDPVKTKVEFLEKTVNFLSERVDEMENRGRRRNIRIVGIPEDVEGTDPTRFFERWLPDALQIKTKNDRIKLERAHRSLAPKPSSQQRPRPVIVRFHNYQDKQRVMDASWDLARKNQLVKHGDSTVMFFQDFSAALVRKRKGYINVKKRLQALGADYRLLYPAKLKVTYRGSSQVFDNPTEAEKYVDTVAGGE